MCVCAKQGGWVIEGDISCQVSSNSAFPPNPHPSSGWAAYQPSRCERPQMGTSAPPISVTTLSSDQPSDQSPGRMWWWERIWKFDQFNLFCMWCSFMIDEGEILQQNHMMMKPKGSFDILTAWVSHSLVFLWHRCKEFKRYLCEIKRDTKDQRLWRMKMWMKLCVAHIVCSTTRDILPQKSWFLAMHSPCKVKYTIHSLGDRL